MSFLLNLNDSFSIEKTEPLSLKINSENLDVYTYTNAMIMQLLMGRFNERFTMFWLDFFPVYPRKMSWMIDYYNVLNINSLVTFKEIIKGCLKCAAWVHYLDGHNSFKNAPNENLPRELLEIYTIGKGNYSKSDIEHLANFFSGLRINWNTLSGDIYWDNSERKILNFKLFGQKVNDIEGLVEVLLSKKQTSKNIVSKAIRYFNLSPSVSQTEKICNIYYDSDYDNLILAEELSKLKQSEQEFCYHPVETVILLAMNTGFKFKDDKTTYEFLRECSFEFCNPPSVRGWNIRAKLPTLLHKYGYKVLWEIKNRDLAKDSYLFKMKSRLNKPSLINYRYRWDCYIPHNIEFNYFKDNWFC